MLILSARTAGGGARALSTGGIWIDNGRGHGLSVADEFWNEYACQISEC
jgi:hypothetical protein